MKNWKMQKITRPFSIPCTIMLLENIDHMFISFVKIILFTPPITVFSYSAVALSILFYFPSVQSCWSAPLGVFAETHRHRANAIALAVANDVTLWNIGQNTMDGVTSFNCWKNGFAYSYSKGIFSHICIYIYIYIYIYNIYNIYIYIYNIYIYIYILYIYIYIYIYI